MPRRPSEFSPALLLLSLATFSGVARAQIGVSPEAAPAVPEVSDPLINSIEPQRETTPAIVGSETAPDEKMSATSDAKTNSQTMLDGIAPPTTGDATAATATESPTPARLKAASVTYQGTTILASGTPENPVSFQSAAGLVVAQEVRLDTQTQQLRASGSVQFERERVVQRKELRPRRLAPTFKTETFRETAFGNNLVYDFKTGQGTLDNAKLQLPTLTITVGALEINGKSYRARDVVLRPGGLTEEELKIYGTPPFNLRAREITIAPIERNGVELQRATLRGGGLYFKKTRILPVPNYSFYPGGGTGDGPRIIPGISFNSGDQVLVTTNFAFPLNKLNPEQLTATTDIGYSARVGFRGGVSLTSSIPVGQFALNLRKNDIISTQLTNRIQLDRRPEFVYRSPSFFEFNLGKQRAGFAFDASLGDFTENLLGDSRRVSSTRSQGRLVFTTRLQPGPGAFVRLFSSYAKYGAGGSYSSNGIELGYAGQLLKRVRGQVSIRQTDLNGQTPFRFDQIEIARELRATVNYQLSPRYLIPVDLRYDLQRNRFRDQTFGILRSYKTFAYGVTYQTARKDLRLEIQQGF